MWITYWQQRVACLEGFSTYCVFLDVLSVDSRLSSAAMAGKRMKHLYTEDAIESYINSMLYSAVVLKREPNFGLELKSKKRIVLGGWFYKAKTSKIPFKVKKNTEPKFFALDDQLQRVAHDGDVVHRVGLQKPASVKRSGIVEPVPYSKIQFVIVRVIHDPFTVFVHIEGGKTCLILTPEEPADTELVARFVAALRFRIHDYNDSLLKDHDIAHKAAIKIQTIVRRMLAKKRAERIRGRRKNILNPALKAMGIGEEVDSDEVFQNARKQINSVTASIQKNLTAGSRLSLAVGRDLVAGVFGEGGKSKSQISRGSHG